MVFCTECGARCGDGARFCGNCGHKLITDAGDAPKAESKGSQRGVPVRPGDQVKQEDGITIITHAPQATGLLCAKCNKAITNESFAVSALGKKWHKECFSCSVCHERLFSFARFFQDENGMPVCAKCNAKDVPRCCACGKPVHGKYIIACGKNFHEECCRCAGCGKPFGPEGFFEDGGKLWHLECAE